MKLMVTCRFLRWDSRNCSLIRKSVNYLGSLAVAAGQGCWLLYALLLDLRDEHF